MVEFCVRRRLFNVYRRESPGSVGLLPQERLVQDRTEHFALSGLSVTYCIYSFIYLFILLLTPREREEKECDFLQHGIRSVPLHTALFTKPSDQSLLYYGAHFSWQYCCCTCGGTLPNSLHFTAHVLWIYCPALISRCRVFALYPVRRTVLSRTVVLEKRHVYTSYIEERQNSGVFFNGRRFSQAR